MNAGDGLKSVLLSTRWGQSGYETVGGLSAAPLLGPVASCHPPAQPARVTLPSKTGLPVERQKLPSDNRNYRQKSWGFLKILWLVDLVDLHMHVQIASRHQASSLLRDAGRRSRALVCVLALISTHVVIVPSAASENRGETPPQSAWTAQDASEITSPSMIVDLPPTYTTEVAHLMHERCRLLGGAEVIFFKPFAEAGSTPQQAIVLSDATTFLPAWRLWGGWSDSDGLGCRVRWWQYDQTQSAESAFGAVTSTRLIFQKLDIEVTQQMNRHRWDLIFSGGFTWIGNEMQLSSSSLSLSEFDRWRMDAVGLTAGLQGAVRSRWFEHWRWCGSVQGSGVFGNSLSQTVSEPIGSQPSTLGGILEFTMGPRWERRIAGGTTVFAGGNAEAQYWMTSLGSFEDGLVPDGQGALGLVGLSVNVGIRR